MITLASSAAKEALISVLPRALFSPLTLALRLSMIEAEHGHYLSIIVYRATCHVNRSREAGNLFSLTVAEGTRPGPVSGLPRTAFLARGMATPMTGGALWERNENAFGSEGMGYCDARRQLQSPRAAHARESGLRERGNRPARIPVTLASENKMLLDLYRNTAGPVREPVLFYGWWTEIHEFIPFCRRVE